MNMMKGMKHMMQMGWEAMPPSSTHPKMKMSHILSAIKRMMGKGKQSSETSY